MKIKNLLLSPWTALLTLALILSIRTVDPSFVESVRLRYFDSLILSKPVTDNNIYTVNIDEDALDRYGQWPLPRNIYAEIIEDLYRRNAGLVVFNILLPSNDRNGQDARLATTLKDHAVILPSAPSDQTRNQPRNPGSVVLGPEFLDRLVNYPGILANIPILENAAAGIGLVNTLPEIDGVNRRVPLVIAVEDKLYPNLALETLRVAASDDTFQIKLNENGVEKLRIPAFGPINTDNLGRVWIDWQQQSKSVSLMNLPEDFEKAVVVVGVTAAGLANPVPTSVGAVFPHHAQASIIATLINQVVIQRPDYADGLEIIAIVVLSIILLILTRWIYVGIAAVIVMAFASVYGSYVVYQSFLYLIDATALVASTLLVSLHAYGIKFISEYLQKQQIKKQFGTYLSPAMVEKLQKNPKLLQLGGDSRELSIMFTDVRGFTSISEHYGKDVQGLTKIMNRYMTAMTAKILDNQGTLDKYIGDAQMAFWNAPLDDTEHAKNAVRTGLAMMGSLDAFNKEIAAEGVPPFGMGLGINTDTVVVGNMGSSQRFDYTCLGDGVNLASRLEGQSKPYGVKIVLGPKTAEYVKDEYIVLELDKIAVKGKKEGVHIFTVLSQLENSVIKRKYLLDKDTHDLMLRNYRKQNFKTALNLLKELQGKFDGQMDGYYNIWEDRITEMMQKELPIDWDGTYVATSK
jgi:adenylate cyclase